MNRIFWCVLAVTGLVLSAVAAGLVIAVLVSPTTHAVIVPLETPSG